jgi:hypothetical protein
MFLLVYVDDNIIASSSSSVMSELLQSFQHDFALKYLGPLHYFLGIKVKRSADGLQLSQQKCTNALLERAGMVSCKLVSTPLTTSTKILAHDGDLLSSADAMKYWSIIRVLQ